MGATAITAIAITTNGVIRWTGVHIRRTHSDHFDEFGSCVANRSNIHKVRT